MNFQPILDDINHEIRPLLGQDGRVARYIPALARVSPLQFGIALRGCDGHEAAAGDCATPFSIQSISKVFSLTLAMQRSEGESLWERIGREPSGSPFNLDSAVGCARECRTRRDWQGVTTPRANARKEEQRGQARRVRCSRAHSVLTQTVNRAEAKIVNVHGALLDFDSGQLPNLG